MAKSETFVLCPKYKDECDIDTCPRFLQNVEIRISPNGRRSASGFCFERGSRYITRVPQEYFCDRQQISALKGAAANDEYAPSPPSHPVPPCETVPSRKANATTGCSRKPCAAMAGKYDKLDAARKQIDYSAVKVRIHFDLATNIEGYPLVIFKRYFPKNLEPQDINDYIVSRPVIYQGHEKISPIEFGYNKIIQMGYYVTRNKLFKEVVRESSTLSDF